jgi:hypothetical protein
LIIKEQNSAIIERNTRQDMIAGAGGFYSGFWFPHKEDNSAIDGSRNWWVSVEGYWEMCGGTLKAPATRQTQGTFLAPYGTGYAALNLSSGRGNIIKFAGSSPIFTSSGPIQIFEPVDFGEGPGNIKTINDSLSNIASIAPYRAVSKSLRSSAQIGMQEIQSPPQLIQPLAPKDTKMTGAFTIRVTYNRPITGGESNGSAPSNTLTLTNSSVIIKFPSPPQSVYVDVKTATEVFSNKVPSAWDTNDFWLIYAAPKNFTTFATFHRVSKQKVWERFLQNELYDKNDCSATETVVSGGFEITITLPGTGAKDKVFGRFANDLYNEQEFREMLIGKRAISGTFTGTVSDVTWPAGNDITQIKIFSTTSWAANIGAGKLLNDLQLKASIKDFSDERLFETSWEENDLTTDLAPIDNFPPIAQCDFVAAVNTILLLINTGGRVGGGRTSIAVSTPGFFESFPPENYISLPEECVGIAHRPDDAYIYLLSRQAIYELRWTGADTGVALRTITNSVGTASQSSFTVVNQNIFTFTPNNRIVLVSPGGDVNYQFAEDVIAYVKNWDATKVSVAHDEARNAVVFAHGREFLAFFIDKGIWSTPVQLNTYPASPDIPSLDIASSLTYRGVVHFMTANDNVIERDGNAAVSPIGLGAVTGTISIGSNPGLSIGDTIFIRWPSVLNVNPDTFYQFTVTAFFGGGIYQFGGIAYDKFGNTLNINPSQPCKYQRYVQSPETVFWLDRSPIDGTLANHIVDARLRFNWNSFGHPMLGKTLNKYQAITDFNGTFNIDIYRDFNKFSTLTFVSLTNPSGAISQIADANIGVFRYYAHEIKITGARRKFYALIIDSVMSGIRSNF